MLESGPQARMRAIRCWSSAEAQLRLQSCAGFRCRRPGARDLRGPWSRTPRQLGQTWCARQLVVQPRTDGDPRQLPSRRSTMQRLLGSRLSSCGTTQRRRN